MKANEHSTSEKRSHEWCTPAPWEVLKECGDWTVQYFVSDDEPVPVAIINDGLLEREQIANAHLIASAPALLEALHAFCDISYNTEDDNWSEVQKAFDLALDAIQKAKARN